MTSFDWNMIIDGTLPVMSIVTPRNVNMSALFGKSFAYYTLKERLPVILTKVIDQLSKGKGDTQTIAAIAKLKSDLVTNKTMEPLQETSEEAKNWNRWIAALGEPHYFTSVWVFSECYVYRRLSECFDIKMKGYDPFQQQKQDAFTENLEASSIVARKLDELVSVDSNKDSIQTLLKLSLWANKCDLSLTSGASADQVLDPVEMIGKLKPNLLVDDSGKIADFILDKANAMQKKIDETNFENVKCSCNRLAAARGLPTFEIPENPEESTPKEIPTDKRNPCPSKLVVSTKVTLDIICDNAGYELVTDLCIGHFLLAKGIVQRVRYYVKAIPWFVSDVTPSDFQWVVDQCASANFIKELPRKEGEEELPSEYVGDGSALDKDPARFITSKHLQTLGKECQRYLKEGMMVVEVDTFWTSPHLYKDMKKIDPALYRKLQFALIVLFKGDLNYRKLVGEMNWPPTTTFEAALQGFTPAPLAAVRTVKADLVAGLPRGKWEELTALDDKWMEKGEYGLIQFCPKKEELKATDVPCPEFGKTCKGVCE